MDVVAEPYRMTAGQERFAKFARWLFRRLLKIFLREVIVLETDHDLGEVAQVKSPSLRHELPTLLIANHPNGLIDGVIVYCTARTTIRSVVKSTLYNQIFLRPLLFLAGSVPVNRRQDSDELRKGLHPAGDKIKSSEEAINLVSRALCRHTFVIFPEGISHTGAQMTPFKTGASRMLLSAAAYVESIEDRSTLAVQHSEDLSFQPVGLYFDDARTFRSRGLIHYGKRQYLSDIFSPGELQEIKKRPLDPEFVKKLTDHMEIQLRALLPEAQNPKQREFTRRLASLLYEANRKTKISDIYQWELVVKSILQQFIEFPKEDSIRLQKKVDAYFAHLAENGIRDAAVRDLNLAKHSYIRRLYFNQQLYWIPAIVFAPLTIVGIVLYYLPYWLTGQIAFNLADGEVELSTYKFLGGIIMFFVFFMVYTVVLVAFALGAGWSWAWFFASALLPASTGFCALIFSEKFIFRMHELRILLSSKLRKKIYALGKERERLIDDLIAYL